ncbi:hypothetical protein [Brevundimonas sp.]|uniref:hypothetical protein n=1 Tax=Brevundimonas sp. TaxID=1871086 RepID=UPI0025F26DAD|nr:hypothetical protein [Brevundimonas sp.]
MQALIEFIAAVVALLATAALSNLGVDLEPRPTETREIHRVRDCPEPVTPVETASRANQDC